MRIPQFTRRIVQQTVQSGNIRARAAAEGGIAAEGHRQDAARAFQSSRKADAIGDNIIQQNNAQKKIRAQEKMNVFEREQIEAQQKWQNERLTNPDNYAKDFDDYLAQNQEDFISRMESEEGVDYDTQHFRSLADRYRISVFAKSTNWENDTRRRNVFSRSEEALEDMNKTFMLSDPSYGDFIEHTEKQRAYINEVASGVFGEEDRAKLAAYGIDTKTKEFMQQKLLTEPKTLDRILKLGRGQPEQVMDYVIDIEGKSKIAKEPDGGIAKYGINSIEYGNRHGISHEAAKAAVRNLNYDSAMSEYKKYYWDDRLDDLEPAMRVVAYDAIVNHGNDKDTWNMIDRADGNPNVLIAARRKKYAGLIASNPKKYAEYRNGWEKRMQEMGETSALLTEAGGTQFNNFMDVVDGDILADVQSKLPRAIKDQEDAEAEAVDRENVVSKVQKIQNENSLHELVYDDSIPYDQKLQALAKADYEGVVRDKFVTEAKAFLKSKQTKKSDNYDPEAIASLQAKASTLFEKDEDEYKIKSEMLGEAGLIQAEALKMAATGQIKDSEAKTIVKNMTLKLAAATRNINKRRLFGDRTHYENAFKYFTEKTDDPGLRNRMFRMYAEKAETLDALAAEGNDDEVKKQSQAIMKNAQREALVEKIPSLGDLDELPNNVFRIDGGRVFVGAHASAAPSEKIVQAEFKTMRRGDAIFRVYPDGTAERIQ